MKKKIIDTGKHLPKPSAVKQLQFLADWDRIVPPKVERQSRRDGTVLYGGRAVNALVGIGLHRPSHDFDVYSKSPKKHALELERHIDQTTGTNMAYVKETYYERKGKKKKLYRVETVPEGDEEADYQQMPRDIEFVTKNGIRYETLGRAKSKYDYILKHGEEKRQFKAHQDISRIELYELLKGVKKL